MPSCTLQIEPHPIGCLAKFMMLPTQCVIAIAQSELRVKANTILAGLWEPLNHKADCLRNWLTLEGLAPDAAATLNQGQCLADNGGHCPYHCYPR